MAAAVTENQIYPCVLDSIVRSFRTFEAPASADTLPRACSPPTTYSMAVPFGLDVVSKRDVVVVAVAAYTSAAAVGDARASWSLPVSTAACHLSAVGPPVGDAYCSVGAGAALVSGTRNYPRDGSRQRGC